MSTVSLKPSQIKFTNFKSKSSINHSNSPSLAPLTKALSQRNAIIYWIYNAQHILSFSRSSLFMGIAVLDKLLVKGMALTEANCELIGGTLTLLITKFNEVVPVTVRKLQALSTESIEFSKYVQTQENILQTLDFDISPEDPVYQNLAELETKLKENSDQIIKIAIMNPAVAFKLGQATLVAAIESMFNGGLVERKNDFKFTKQSVQLRTQLQRLLSRSPANKRLVNPKRA